MPYRTLSADNIEATIEKLHKRIAERFPNRGIVKLCGELLIPTALTTDMCPAASCD